MSSIQPLRPPILHRPTATEVALLVSSVLRHAVLIVLAIILIFALLPAALGVVGNQPGDSEIVHVVSFQGAGTIPDRTARSVDRRIGYPGSATGVLPHAGSCTGPFEPDRREA